MAIHRVTNMMKQEMKAWKSRNFLIFGFFIACIGGILFNIIAHQSKPPELKYRSEAAVLRMLRYLPSGNETAWIPTQNCHFATSPGRWAPHDQEDRLTCDLNLNITLSGRTHRIGAVAVFDGHGGSSASDIASKIFLDRFMLNINNSIEQSSDLKEILKSSLVKTINDIEAEFSQVALEYHLISGTTAVVALIYDNHVLVANVGDSKAFLCSRSKISSEGTASLGGLVALELTSDHNAYRLEEKVRVQASGGVFRFTPGYVPVLKGFFPLTRVIGNLPFKKYGVIADPELTDWPALTPKDEFLVVASSGIFEMLTTQAVCDFLDGVKDRSDPSLLADQLVSKAYFKGSTDNLSVVLVPLRSGEPDLSVVSSSTGV